MASNNCFIYSHLLSWAALPSSLPLSFSPSLPPSPSPSLLPSQDYFPGKDFLRLRPRTFRVSILLILPVKLSDTNHIQREGPTPWCKYWVEQLTSTPQCKRTSGQFIFYLLNLHYFFWQCHGAGKNKYLKERQQMGIVKGIEGREKILTGKMNHKTV